MERKLFVTMNGFDERFLYSAMEDVDLYIRLKKENFKTCFFKDASLCHPWRSIIDTDYFNQHLESTFTFLELHPEELVNINSVFFLKANIRSFIKETIPGLIKYRAKGWKIMLIWHFFNLKKAWLIFYKYKLHKYIIFQNNK